MHVTCYTDASFSTRQGGAWAVWVRSDRGRIVRRGRCPAWVRDPNLAELAAIYAGVYLALTRWRGSVRHVLVRSDSQWAVAVAAGEATKPPRKPARRLQRKLRALVEEHGASLECRWVPGHRPRQESTAAYLNDACDRLAKEARTRRPRSAGRSSTGVR